MRSSEGAFVPCSGAAPQCGRAGPSRSRHRASIAAARRPGPPTVRFLLRSSGMETVQRHAEPAIPPWTEQWSTRRRLGFGVVALIPTALLAATIGCWALGRIDAIAPYAEQALPI